ncbi:toxin-antitoxin system TumE family protein [Achromobacter ruhlandii]|uniref:toxin-antitoxin system TumE family protein n=1 Tax=Achromobacter ruhlandii TaxID=72557 RepID=UPI0006C1A33B|nr:DUF6516 family protein [Achromobacter ruhlandii]AVC42896.1 hypothetical protein AL520_30505 [Achromobacter xylosoxidans]CUI40139.1 Uncharacterised protein [Achromobacter ruhlandii]CUI88831.1 Uncharacterised protein [Achromobacter ruhlandii]CUJ84284.1 Uncharacterised protein [Achromobacter ruhlandii]
MANAHQWRLFNIDSLLAEIDEPPRDAATVDLYVAALSYKNFDFIERRLPFVFESVTYDLDIWKNLIAAAPLKYWVRNSQEEVILFSQTDHCGLLRSYRYRGDSASGIQMQSPGWITVADSETLYALLDTVAARGIYEAWHKWMDITTREASDLANGRFGNTTVARSLILSSMGYCLACKARAVASARTTIAAASTNATLIQLPLCAEHLGAVKEQPSVLRFLGTLFSLSINIPDLERSDSIPDNLIHHLHTLVAEELGGLPTDVEKRERGWHLTIQFENGWHWLLRLNTLMDYSYMLFDEAQKKQVYRADSAPHHHDLPFPPHHEHSRPNRKKDVPSPSFLYGNPFFDLKRLRDVGQTLMQSKSD